MSCEFASPLFAHKKVKYPKRDGVCQADHRAAALSGEEVASKKFVTKFVWYFMMWAQYDIVQRAVHFPKDYQPLTVVYDAICHKFPCGTN